VAGNISASAMGTQCRLVLGNRSQTDIPDTAAIHWLNWSLNYLASPQVFRHRELLAYETSLTLATSTATYTIPSGDTFGVHSVVIRNNSTTTERYRLEPLRERDGFEWSGVPANGRPTHYSQYRGASTIEVHPTPTSAYNGWNLYLLRWKAPTQFTLDGSSLLKTTETSPLHIAFDEPLFMGMVWRGWRHLREWERAEQAKAEMGQLVNEIKERLNLEGEDTDFGPQVVVDQVM
jgi:hypothetical protein